MSDITQIIIAVIGSIGFWEIARHLLNKRSNDRKAEAEADSAEFRILREMVEWLQEQLRKKEERFVEQTDIVRNQNRQILELTNALADEKMAHRMDECQDRNCPFRQPPKAYTPPRDSVSREEYFAQRETENLKTETDE